MKAKKKINPSTKKPAKKPLPRPQLLFVDKTLVTTKEKTHNTLEDPI